MKIMIDIDDTIVNEDGWLYLVNSFLKTNYTIDDVDGYYIQDLVPKEKKEEFTKYFVTKNTYDYAGIFPNCVDVIKKLNEKHDVYICSTYIFRDDLDYSGKALKYKYDFLRKNFSFMDPNKFAFLTNKEIFDCEVKIDDKINNLTNAKIKLLYTAYHNKNISDEELKKQNIIRVNNWKDIEKILLSN